MRTTNIAGSPSVRTAVRAVISGGTLAATFAGLAHAQEQAAAPAEPSASAPAEVVVTGSRISSPNETAISPVTFVGSEQIQQTGLTRVEDVLNALPFVFADQSSSVVNASNGTASVNLYGLGAQRTLVLVNGARLGPGDPGAGSVSDLNFIPLQLVDGVEVLTGGASTTYGADAVSGVVNFKLKQNFEGVEVIANGGVNQNSNADYGGVDAALAGANGGLPAAFQGTGPGQIPVGYPQAPGNVFTGAQTSVALLAGLNTSDGKGNATVYATYTKDQAVLESKFTASACSLSSGYLGGPYNTNGKFTCSGSATTTPALFDNVITGATGQVGPHGTLDTGGIGLYNYGALNYFQRPDERYTAGAFLHYDINDHVTVYSSTMFMDDYTVAQIASAGDFGTSGSFTCNNPYLSSQEFSFFGCGPNNADGYVAANNGNMTDPNVLIYRRNVEGGNRLAILEHTDFRELLGVKGAINDTWTYDASFQYNLVNQTSNTANYFSTVKMNNAFNVVPNPATGGVAGVAAGTPVCQSAINGTDPACVPYNLFQPGGVTPAALNYLYTPGLQIGRVEQEDVILQFNGDLGKYGIQLPSAKDGAQINLGTEYRDVRETQDNDAELESGDLSGGAGATPSLAGTVQSRELFTEVLVPIASDQFLAKSINLDMGYRVSDYSLDFHATSTYKFSADWAPTDDVRLRATFSRAERAPNVSELFSLSSILLDGSYTSDPCAGASPIYSQAQCARGATTPTGTAGVSAAQYGHVQPNPASQYNGLLGGNQGLHPETALTTDLGIVLTPRFLPGFHANIDYYDIDIENVITDIGGTTILDECYTKNLFCDDIHRDSAGDLWTSKSGYIVDTLQNVGGMEEKGINLDTGYAVGLGAYGRLNASLVGTYIISQTTLPLASDTSTQYECVGLYGGECGTPVFHWRHTLGVTWQTPWKAASVTARWRYFGPATVEGLGGTNLRAGTGSNADLINSGAVSSTDAYIASYSFFDLEASVQVNDVLNVRVGCNNLFDKQPPLIGITNLPLPVGNGNTFPGVWDAMGRYLFAEVVAKF